MNYLILLSLLILILFFLFRKNKQKKLIKIVEPNIALVSMSTDEGVLELVRQDSFLYSNIYKNVYQRNVRSISELLNLIEDNYDLLHFLIDINEEGEIMDNDGNMIKLSVLISKIQKMKTKHLFFAKDNNYDNYQNDIKGLKVSINLVMIINRKGQSFNKFFKKLFTKMSLGRTMAMSWSESAKDNETPDALYISGIDDDVILLSDN
ncbi:hypothetical protein [Jejuia spongiicola]|uniref:Uncharacterized protein n=1 Tax=Jejuia spongiicola TaxID=2942207 RepID=A0ABT0QD46_9FLAO|nr:hypothetical protein [Jejuia spongiicola]MCL6294914.1 hypothetical protein [Jejuia spongiicola]